MSNMLYACSMLYRAKLPMVIVLNKVDVVGCEFVKEWMEDYESFQEALDDATGGGGGRAREQAKEEKQVVDDRGKNSSNRESKGFNNRGNRRDGGGIYNGK